MGIDRRTFALSLLVSGLGFVVAAADNDSGPPKRPAVDPLDMQDRIAVQLSDDQRFGISALKLKDPRFPDKPKRLTRYERGDTNNTRLHIDGVETMFGRELPNAGIKWARMDDKVQKDVRSADGRTVTSVMDYSRDKIRITQTVEIIVGEQTRLFDTALVTYRVENSDVKSHTVGLRAMIDTYFGTVDGVPFLAAPTDKESAQLVDTILQLSGSEIPSFLRILESGKLGDPQTLVAEMGLRLRGYEPPDRMLICRWPEGEGGSEARWNWSYKAINQSRQSRAKDSCVVLYWPKISMAGGTKFTAGYTYGLGAISDGKDGGSGIRLLAGGACAAGQTFTLTAYVKDPKKDDKARLQLPAQLKLAPGQKNEQELSVGLDQDYAQVSWRVQATTPGAFKVSASAGSRSASRTVYVRESSLLE